MYNFSSHNKYLFKQLDTFINSIKNKEDSLIQILHYTKDIFRYIPKEVKLYIFENLNISLIEIYDIINFYSYFTTDPKSKYKINICLGKVCYAKGASEILAEFEKQLGIKSGQTSKDFLFSLNGIRCIGACGLAPVVVV